MVVNVPSTSFISFKSSALTDAACLVTCASIVSSPLLRIASLSLSTVESLSIAYPSCSGVISNAPLTLFIVALTGASGFLLLALLKNAFKASSLNSISGVMLSGFSIRPALFANLSIIFPDVYLPASDSIYSLFSMLAPRSEKLLSICSPFTDKINFFSSTLV